VVDDARVRALREAVTIAPEDVQLRRMLADALLASGEVDDAIGEYRVCLRLEPDDRDTLFALAGAFHRSGKRSAALMTIEDLLARTGDDAPASLLQARILLEAGRSAEAATAYQAAVEADPRLEDVTLGAALGAATVAQPESHGGPGSAERPDEGLPPFRSASSDDLDADGEDEVHDPGHLHRSSSAPITDPPRGPVGVPASGISGPDEEIDRTFEMERPRITFEHVGGMDSLKEEIRTKIIYPLEHPELYAAYGKSAGGGILLYGPPGCGKTHLARATAGEVRAGFLAVGIDDVLDMWLGRSERNLHEFFETGRRNRPCVVFFDEVDAIGANRTDLRMSAGRTVVNQFLAELDGSEASNDGVLILAATNAPWHLDPAFRRPGRFDRVLFVPPPDATARAAILRVLLAGKPVSDIDVEAIASRTDGYSGADLRGIVDIAIEDKLRAAIADHIPRPIVTRDLLDAVKRTVPTTREWFATARNYVLYANQGGQYDAVRPFLRL
jgi:AAA+ superfamily predicted ATPase